MLYKCKINDLIKNKYNIFSFHHFIHGQVCKDNAMFPCLPSFTVATKGSAVPVVTHILIRAVIIICIACIKASHPSA